MGCEKRHHKIRSGTRTNTDACAATKYGAVVRNNNRTKIAFYMTTNCNHFRSLCSMQRQSFNVHF